MRRLSINTKWTIFSLIFIFSFSFILVSYFLSTGKKGLEKELKRWGASLSDNLAYSARPPVMVQDYHTLNNYLYGIMNHSEMLYCAIIDKDSSYLAIQDPHAMLVHEIFNHSLCPDVEEIREFSTSEGLSYYNFVKHIQFEKEHGSNEKTDQFDPLERAIADFNNQQNKILKEDRLGTVVIGISSERMKTKLKAMRNRAIYIAIVSALVFTGFVLWGVNRITMPIKNLDEATHKVAQGDLTHFVAIDRVDELGRLADSFNEMIVKLRESQEKEKLYTQTLEHQVSERTHELKVSEQKYRTLFEHAGTAVVLLDIDGKFNMINQGFEILSGYAEQELNGKISFSEFLTTDDCKKIKELYDENGAINEKHFPINHECTFIDRFENRKNINLTISLIPGTLKLLVSIADVTELRDLQKRLTRSEQLATLGELSAAIAHEIRNPLVAIHTSVGILKSALDLNNEDEELMDIIAEESMRLNKIVDDFLKFARPHEPQFIDADINNIIEETLTVLRSRFNEKIQKNIQLSNEIPLVSADPNQLKQVFMNMFINAIEAMPDGGELNISTRYVKSRNSQPTIEVVVKDTGIGIEEQELKKIFQPFYTHKLHGVGMGLAICERIIQNHGGQIKVTSVLGEGAQFNIILPA